LTLISMRDYQNACEAKWSALSVIRPRHGAQAYRHHKM